MKALKYKVKVQIDPVHSWGDRVIEEIFIPSIACCFNQEGFAFLAEVARSTQCEDIEIDRNIVQKIQQYVKFKTELENICADIFSETPFDKSERK